MSARARKFGLARHTAISAAAFLLPAGALAVCTCGFGDGQLTLATIPINGDLSDWAVVHADTDNNVCDGPANSLTDRDAPVQSTGRDLTHFAYSWDATNIYLFTERSGSPTNTQSFVYYADVDNDQLMETGEPVIGVTWQGSNREISVYTFTYVADDPAGDPMVDVNGYGDGYTLPGSFANVPSTGNPNRAGTWGSADGLQMEFYVTWAELGVAPGAAFTFHVASSNAALGASSFTAQVDDNLSGCGGGLGSTAMPGASFTADESLTGFASQTVVAAHTLTNTGNASDYFDLSYSASGDFAPAVSYYLDSDGNGSLNPGDNLLTDTDGDGDVDSGLVSAGQSVGILVAYDIPAGVNPADIAVVAVTAASDFQPAASDFVTDTITIALPPQLVVAKDASTVSDPVNGTANPKAIPGAEVEYVVTVTNQGPGTVDNNTFSLTDEIAANSCLRITDLGAPGGGPLLFADGSPPSNLAYSFLGLGNTGDDLEFSNDGGLTFSYSPSANPDGCDPSVTHIRVTPQGVFAGDTGGGSPQATFTFRVILQ
jgi:hypothetical protein